MSTNQVEQVLQGISERLQAIDDSTSAKALKPVVVDMIKEYFQENPDDASGFLHNVDTNNKRGINALRGTKYERYELGLNDIEFAHLVCSSAHRDNPTMYKAPSEYLENAYSEIKSTYYIPPEVIQSTDKKMDGVYPDVPIGYQRGFTPSGERAMNTITTGIGSELIGAEYIRDLWEGARNDSPFFGRFNSFQMQDPTTFLPVEVDFPEMKFIAENTAFPSVVTPDVNTQTSRVQVDAKKFVIHQVYSGEMDEDSLVPLVPILRSQVQKSLSYYTDSLILNGDITAAAVGNVNSVDAAPLVNSHYLAFDGIRKACLVDNPTNSLAVAAVPNLSMFSDIRSLMIDIPLKMNWGRPRDQSGLFYLTDPLTYEKLVQIPEVITRQNFGDNATLNTGEVAMINGIPIYQSMTVSPTDVTGKVSSVLANNIKGQVLLINPAGFKVGWRRSIQLEVQKLPANDQVSMYYSLRLGFGRYNPTVNPVLPTGIEACSVAYNITV